MRRPFGFRARSLAVALILAAAAGACPDLLGVRAALAQAPGVVLENVTLGFGEMRYTARRVEVRGTPLSQGELAAILDTNSPEPLPARVARLEAAEIVVPELVSELDTPRGRQVTTYRDVVLSRVARGRIESVTSSAGTVEAPGPAGVANGGFDRFSLQDLELGLAIALFTGQASGASAEMKRIYGAFSLDGMTLIDPSGITTRVGRLSGRDLSARATSAGWIETMRVLGATPDLKAASPEDRRRSLEATAELFDAFHVGAMEASDIRFSGKAQDDPAGRIARIAFTGATATAPAGFAIDGFEAGGDGSARVRFASLNLGGLSLAPVLEGLREYAATGAETMSPATARRLIPMIGSVRLVDLDVEVPGESQPGAATGTRVTMKGAEILAAKPVDGVASELKLSLRNLAFPVPPDAENQALQQLAGLGYDRVDGSIALDLGWNEQGQELAVREISVDSADMGRATLRGVVGNVSRDIFNPDSAIASVAFMGATAKSVELGLENRGLFERFVAREGRRQRRNPEDIRREYGMAAAVGIPAMLGSSPGAKTLAQVVARFVAKPGKLTVRARAKQAGGFGIADFSARPDPTSVLDAIEITAVAE